MVEKDLRSLLNLVSRLRTVLLTILHIRLSMSFSTKWTSTSGLQFSGLRFRTSTSVTTILVEIIISCLKTYESYLIELSIVKTTSGQNPLGDM